MRIPNSNFEVTGDQTTNPSKWSYDFVILYFYPKDSTPGCTQEGQDFSSLYNQIKKCGAEVFGVSRDSIKSHENFKDKQKYKFDLISDSDEKLCKAFSVLKEKKLYGKSYVGIERSTFLLDKNRKVIKEWRNVKVDGHAKEVVALLKTL